MPISSLIALSILPILSVAVGLQVLKRLRLPRRESKLKSRFGLYPIAAGNALKALQAIVQPSVPHAMELCVDDKTDEDDTGDPNDPLQHLHHQAARIRRGEPIDCLTTLLPRSPSNSDPPS